MHMQRFADFQKKELPADGWFVYDMASFQNATRGTCVLFIYDF